MKLSHLAYSQPKHQADSTTQGPILLSTIIYIWLIEQNPFFFCHSSVIRNATCLSSPSTRGERPREKTQGAVNPAKSDSPNLGKLLRASRGAWTCREVCWPEHFGKVVPRWCWDNKNSHNDNQSVGGKYEMNSNKPHSISSSVTWQGLKDIRQEQHQEQTPHLLPVGKEERVVYTKGTLFYSMVRCKTLTRTDMNLSSWFSWGAGLEEGGAVFGCCPDGCWTSPNGRGAYDVFKD